MLFVYNYWYMYIDI